MQDIFTSIKAYLYDRCASPLMGAFIVSWAVWNYRFFVILLSPGSLAPSERFEAIGRLFSAYEICVRDWSIIISGKLVDGVLIPAALSFIYLFVYPLVAKPVYQHSLRKQKELRAIKQEQENQRLLSVEESREIYRRLAQMQSKHQSEIDAYNNQISSLNRHIEELEAKNSNGYVGVPTVEVEDSDEAVDADLDKYDELIAELVSNYPGGRFKLNELFGQKRWGELSVSTRRGLGKRFRAQVERGDYVGVSTIGKDSGNQQAYSKKFST